MKKDFSLCRFAMSQKKFIARSPSSHFEKQVVSSVVGEFWVEQIIFEPYCRGSFVAFCRDTQNTVFWWLFQRKFSSISSFNLKPDGLDTPDMRTFFAHDSSSTIKQHVLFKPIDQRIFVFVSDSYC